MTAATAGATSVATFAQAGCATGAEVAIVGSTASVAADIAQRFLDCGGADKVATLCQLYTDAQIADMLRKPPAHAQKAGGLDGFGVTDNCLFHAEAHRNGRFVAVYESAKDSYARTKAAHEAEGTRLEAIEVLGRPAFVVYTHGDIQGAAEVELLVQLENHTFQAVLRDPVQRLDEADLQALIARTREALPRRY